jgi:uncharacterized protein YqeY
VSELKQRITEDMKTAMRAKDKQRLATIRLILAAIKQREVDERIELDDTAVLAVLDKMVKQRRDSIAQFEKAERSDLVAQEQSELQVIAAYMPQPLGEGEIAALIDEAVASSGAASLKDMGKVMGALKPRVQGRADMGKVSARVKQRLAGG